MANLNESLTIKILGESSGFSRELDRVSSRITDLENRLSGVDIASQRLSSSLQALQNAVQPIQRVSQALDKLRQQLTTLSNTPISLNVQPALNALSQLQQQIASTRSQLQALQGMSLGSGGMTGGTIGFANGGYVSGRPGLDRIPAMLTAGEFVVRESAVNQLGVRFLTTLNEQQTTPHQARATPWQATENSRSPSVSNQTNFGGVNIHVQQVSDLSGLMRELEAGGVRLRNRRG